MSLLQEVFKKFKAWFNNPAGSQKSRGQNVRRKVRPQGPAKRPQRKTPSKTRRKTSKPASPTDKRSPKPAPSKLKTSRRKVKTAPPGKPSPRKKAASLPTTKKRAQKTGVIRPSSMASPESRKTKTRVRVKPTAASSPEIGEITHYFANIKVAVVKVTGQGIRVGDKINIKGKATDLLQKVESMQIESVDVKAAKKGQLVGLKLAKPARVGDRVFIVA